ncbi:MAG TPA: glycosyltransferase family 4 protein [Verrucomicrobiae bacterium]|jgi:glycosyltransferase involved in cell wall biosynthesis|nr:glycosyltransferase family 4 protein [Verrucomicrobiae bacterium]
MKIIFLTQYYPPETGAPQSRLSFLAESMVRKGHSVTVLTGMPNYPTGRIFPGWGGFVRKEERNGVRVLRSWIYPTQSTATLPRLTNYFSFVFSSLAVGAFLLPRADYLLTESPPLFLGITGYLLSRLKRARWIFNVSDLWPESAVRLKKIRAGSLGHRLASRLEHFCYRKCWMVSGQARGIVSDIQKRFPEIRTFHLSNGVDARAFDPEKANETSRRELGPESSCVAVYAGLHGLAQGLDQILDAAGAAPGSFRAIFFGDGPEKKALLEKSRHMGLRNVEFREGVSADKVPAYLASADFVLVPLAVDLPGAVPSKLYEGMASGKPVLLVAAGEPAEIVRKYRCGIAVEPGDLAGLRAAIEALCSDKEIRDSMGEAGRRAAMEHFNKETISERFAALLEEELPL